MDSTTTKTPPSKSHCSSLDQLGVSFYPQNPYPTLTLRLTLKPYWQDGLWVWVLLLSLLLRLFLLPLLVAGCWISPSSWRLPGGHRLGDSGFYFTYSLNFNPRINPQTQPSPRQTWLPHFYPSLDSSSDAPSFNVSTEYGTSSISPSAGTKYKYKYKYQHTL